MIIRIARPPWRLLAGLLLTLALAGPARALDLTPSDTTYTLSRGFLTLGEARFRLYPHGEPDCWRYEYQARPSGLARLFIGTGARAFRPNRGWRAESLNARIAAGAGFVQTQLCFNMDRKLSLSCHKSSSMSSFSSRFIPAMGSSKSNSAGSAASARPSATRFCKP